MPNLSLLLEDSATAHPDRTAVVAGSTRVSYADLDRAANRVANLLVARGIGHGDKVALSCSNTAQFPAVYFGILKAGATVVPLNILLKGREVTYHLDDSEARALFAHEGDDDLPIGRSAWEGFRAADGCTEFFLITDSPDTVPAIDGVETLDAALSRESDAFESVVVSDEDTAVILYTSGTTGQPKGAELRHRNMRANALVGAELFGESAERPDTYLCTLPLFHSFGQTCIQNAAFAHAGTVVMLPRFDAAAALRLMVDEKVTFFAGVPTMYWGLLGAADESVDVGAISAHLRIAASGGAPLPVEIHQRFQQRFGVAILEGYGLSETSPMASFGVVGQNPRVGSVGVPIPGVEMKLVNPDWTDVPDDLHEDGYTAMGEIAIKGHNIMKGYYRRPEATAEAIRDGWFRSGDLGRKDADGYYYIVDRAKDMIIRGGYNVYPRELEEVLMTHPAVSLVAVIGVPHESHGEEIKAVVVKHAGDPTTEDELRNWGKEQFAAYKYPRVVEFCDDFPMTSTGKILKRAMS